MRAARAASALCSAATLVVLWPPLLACTQAGGHQAGKSTAPAASSAAPVLSASGSGPSLLPAPEPFEEFRRAMRALDWQAAAQSFDELPEAHRTRSELRYARAYCAHELGDQQTVLRLTHQLAKHLPEFKAEIARMRAEAELGSGNAEAALQYFSKQPAAGDQLIAARALLALGKHADARRHVDRALALATQQNGDQELLARIRAQRVAIARAKGQTALMALDLRWLALQAPTTAAARGSDLELEQIKGQVLNKQQRYQRALDFAEAGRIEDVKTELQRLDKAPGPAIPEADLLHAVGWAYYESRQYPQAVDYLDRAVAAGTQHRLKDSFHAARALSRADRDLEAIERYRIFIKSYPKSGLAEDARYLIGRLYYVLGRWQDAALAFNQYLTTFQNAGRFRKTARYELAVTRLAQKDYAKALTGFKRLLDDESDSRLKQRYALLAAIAQAGADDRKAAIDGFRQLIAESPLSFAALAARGRLLNMGEEPPAPMPAPAELPIPEPLEIELPRKAALLMSVGLDRSAESELIDHEPQLKAKHAKRQYESLCQAYSVLTSAERRYRLGQQAASWSLLVEPPNPKTRWLWDCVYPRPYAVAVESAGSEFRVPAELIYAVMRQESAFRPTVVSPAKAVGLMQMIEPTARRVMSALGQQYDPMLLEVPRHNIRFGAYYLRRLLDSFGQNLVLTAAAYNAGPHAVSHWLKSGEELELDVFVARIPYRETRGYVERVLENLARYSYLSGGNAAVPTLELGVPKGLRAEADAY